MNAITTMVIITVLATFVNAQVASGGQFILTQSVVATGGSSVSNGQFNVNGTAGQAVAGQKASISSVASHAGFWIPAELTPTAAHVTIVGRVMTTDGQGIRNVIVTMSGSSSQLRSVTTGIFGYFQFDYVEAGRIYIFSAMSRRFEFSQPSIVRSVNDSLDDVYFVALSN
jgi:hypothetical protein